ncbi:MAG: DUF4411 family protein [Rhizobiaceae bacterium]
MIYLLDADSLIRADRTYYPIKRFPIFWDWLRHNAAANRVKIPFEQYEEIVAGKGELVEWLKNVETKAAILLDEEADPALVMEVTEKGYAPDLDETEQEKVGRDPFLIAYAYAAIERRLVVTFEVSAPKKQRANRRFLMSAKI